MIGLFNADFWYKSYLLEFRLNGVTTDIFTFSVPPESEEFSFPQRKSETKTFGGAVVADYGNDMVNITLSGSTINQELKLIYKSVKGIAMMTGEQEAFYLRDLFRKYGKREMLDGKEVYLYALNGDLFKVKSNPKWWKIYVGQFDISRNKDKPFCYNYKLTVTGEPEVTKKGLTVFNVLDQISNYYNIILAAVEAINNPISLLEGFGGTFISTISSYITSIKATVDNVKAISSTYANLKDSINNSSIGVILDTMGLGDKIAYKATRYYPTIVSDLWNQCVDLVSESKSLYEACSNMKAEIEKSSWQSVKELFDDSVSDLDIEDVYSTLAHEILVAANKTLAQTSKTLNNLGFAVIPGDTETDDQTVITYGYKVVTITEAQTSWDQLADAYYGDSSLSYIIATYNSLNVTDELKAGQSILIPNLTTSDTRDTNNEVYNTPDVKDNYGKDLIIEDKDFSTYNGDLKLASGIDNLSQALLNRYSTLMGARIRLAVYGIKASIGNALNATATLVQASVHQTTIEDPRIDSVEDIQFTGKGDSLNVEVTYIDKNGAKQNFGGVI